MCSNFVHGNFTVRHGLFDATCLKIEILLGDLDRGVTTGGDQSLDFSDHGQSLRSHSGVVVSGVRGGDRVVVVVVDVVVTITVGVVDDGRRHFFRGILVFEHEGIYVGLASRGAILGGRRGRDGVGDKDWLSRRKGGVALTAVDGGGER